MASWPAALARDVATSRGRCSGPFISADEGHQRRFQVNRPNFRRGVTCIYTQPIATSIYTVPTDFFFTWWSVCVDRDLFNYRMTQVTLLTSYILLDTNVLVIQTTKIYFHIIMSYSLCLSTSGRCSRSNLIT